MLMKEVHAILFNELQMKSLIVYMMTQRIIPNATSKLGNVNIVIHRKALLAVCPMQSAKQTAPLLIHGDVTGHVRFQHVYPIHRAA